MLCCFLLVGAFAYAQARAPQLSADEAAAEPKRWRPGCRPETLFMWLTAHLCSRPHNFRTWFETSSLAIQSSCRSNVTASCSISRSRWNDFRVLCRPLQGHYPTAHRDRQGSDSSTPVRQRQDSPPDLAPRELFVHNVYPVRVWHLECLMTFVAVGQ